MIGVITSRLLDLLPSLSIDDSGIRSLNGRRQQKLAWVEDHRIKNPAKMPGPTGELNLAAQKRERFNLQRNH